jgi:amino acid permease
MNKRFLGATFALSGSIIGAGILGLPYIFSKSGFIIGLFWLIFLGVLMMFINLYLGEVALRTKKRHQLCGYAEEYLGKTYGKLMFVAMAFGIYSALIAYLIGEGESLSRLFTGVQNYSLLFGIGFWVVMTLLLREGLQGLKKVSTYGVSIVFLVILVIFFYFIPSVKISNLSYVNISQSFLPIGVILFSLLGFAAIPELKAIMGGQEKKLKKAIILGSLIPVILYILFSFSFVGILGVDVPEVSTLAFGRMINILGIFTMFSCFFALSFALRNTYKYDFKMKKISVFFWVSLFPLILFLLIHFFEIGGFIFILNVGGIVSTGITGILILFMNLNAKRKGKPEYSIPINKFIIFAIILIFVLGVVLGLFF